MTLFESIAGKFRHDYMIRRPSALLALIMQDNSNHGIGRHEELRCGSIWCL